MPATTPSPELEAPGAGPPALELFLMRNFMVPFSSATTSWQQANAIYQTEGEKVLALIRDLDDTTLRRQVLIKRFPGIEDSSRFWSPAMTVEHLVIVGMGILGILDSLRAGKAVTKATRIQDVKPSPETGRAVLETFEKILARQAEKCTRPAQGGELQLRHDHPWFGPMNAHRWHVLNAVHQRIHRMQIEKILAAKT